MEARIIDAVEVRDLVHQGRVHLVAQLLHVVAGMQVGFAVDDDPVGEFAESVAVTFGESEAVVETEQVERAVFGASPDTMSSGSRSSSSATRSSKGSAAISIIEGSQRGRKWGG